MIEDSPFIYDAGARDGIPIVFFHGFPGSHKQGALLVPVAERMGLRVLAPDRPGYGYSKPMSSSEGLRGFILSLERALDRLEITKFYLLGVSGGNPAAVCSAAHFGDRVLGLGSLCGLAPYPETRDLFYKFARTGFDLARRTPDFVLRLTINQLLKNFDPALKLDLMMSKLSESDRAALSGDGVREAMFESMALARRQGAAGIIFDAKTASAPWPVDFAAIKCPYTLWHGTEDTVLPHSLSEYLHGRVSHSRLKLFAGEGHYSLAFGFTEEILRDLVG